MINKKKWGKPEIKFQQREWNLPKHFIEFSISIELNMHGSLGITFILSVN
jgi:hypothetical protein